MDANSANSEHLERQASIRCHKCEKVIGAVDKAIEQPPEFAVCLDCLVKT